MTAYFDSMDRYRQVIRGWTDGDARPRELERIVGFIKNTMEFDRCSRCRMGLLYAWEARLVSDVQIGLSSLPQGHQKVLCGILTEQTFNARPLGLKSFADAEDDDGVFRKMATLSSDLHTAFHAIAQDQSIPHSDDPRYVLRKAYADGEQIWIDNVPEGGWRDDHLDWLAEHGFPPPKGNQNG